MQRILILPVLVSPCVTSEQESFSLNQCFELLTSYPKNYPLAKQSVLLSDQSCLDIESLIKGKLPKLNVSAHASYQSEATSLPLHLPNMTL